jgi:hypothetical protein
MNPEKSQLNKESNTNKEINSNEVVEIISDREKEKIAIQEETRLRELEVDLGIKQEDHKEEEDQKKKLEKYNFALEIKHSQSFEELINYINICNEDIFESGAEGKINKAEIIEAINKIKSLDSEMVKQFPQILETLSFSFGIRGKVSELLEKNKKETPIEKLQEQINSAESLDGLIEIINNFKGGGIEYSDGSAISSNELVNRINHIKDFFNKEENQNAAIDNPMYTNTITRNFGLRDKVQELIQKELDKNIKEKEEYNKKAEELQEQINSASNINELIEIIGDFKEGVRYSDGTMVSSEKLIENINFLREFYNSKEDGGNINAEVPLFLNKITRNLGLRDKVQSLISKEIEQEKENQRTENTKLMIQDKINSAQSLDELIHDLNLYGESITLTFDNGTLSMKDIAESLNALKQNKDADVDQVTDFWGLRGKVQELLEKERTPLDKYDKAINDAKKELEEYETKGDVDYFEDPKYYELLDKIKEAEEDKFKNQKEKQDPDEKLEKGIEDAKTVEGIIDAINSFNGEIIYGDGKSVPKENIINVINAIKERVDNNKSCDDLLPYITEKL